MVDFKQLTKGEYGLYRSLQCALTEKFVYEKLMYTKPEESLIWKLMSDTDSEESEQRRRIGEIAVWLDREPTLPFEWSEIHDSILAAFPNENPDTFFTGLKYPVTDDDHIEMLLREGSSPFRTVMFLRVHWFRRLCLVVGWKSTETNICRVVYDLMKQDDGTWIWALWKLEDNHVGEPFRELSKLFKMIAQRHVTVKNDK